MQKSHSPDHRPHVRGSSWIPDPHHPPTPSVLGRCSEEITVVSKRSMHGASHLPSSCCMACSNSGAWTGWIGGGCVNILKPKVLDPCSQANQASPANVSRRLQNDCELGECVSGLSANGRLTVQLPPSPTGSKPTRTHLEDLHT